TPYRPVRSTRQGRTLEPVPSSYGTSAHQISPGRGRTVAGAVAFDRAGAAGGRVRPVGRVRPAGPDRGRAPPPAGPRRAATAVAPPAITTSAPSNQGHQPAIRPPRCRVRRRSSHGWVWSVGRGHRDPIDAEGMTRLQTRQGSLG